MERGLPVAPRAREGTGAAVGGGRRDAIAGAGSVRLSHRDGWGNYGGGKTLPHYWALSLPSSNRSPGVRPTRPTCFPPRRSFSPGAGNLPCPSTRSSPSPRHPPASPNSGGIALHTLIPHTFRCPEFFLNARAVGKNCTVVILFFLFYHNRTTTPEHGSATPTKTSPRNEPATPGATPSLRRRVEHPHQALG